METRKEQLLKQTYGTLQSTEEYKHYLETFVYNKSICMSSEVDYMLKKSYEDDESPLSYDDLDLNVFNEEECIRLIIEDIKNYLDEDEQKELFAETNEEHNLRIKSIGDYEVFLNQLDEETLKEIAETRGIDEDSYIERAEIYQWFLMDIRLLNQLKERGEIILNNTYWGRQSFGQSIELDGIIIEIFKEWYLNLHWIEEKFNLNKEVVSVEN